MHYSISLRELLRNSFEQISLRNISAEYVAHYFSCEVSLRNSLTQYPCVISFRPASAPTTARRRRQRHVGADVADNGADDGADDGADGIAGNSSNAMRIASLSAHTLCKSFARNCDADLVDFAAKGKSSDLV